MNAGDRFAKTAANPMGGYKVKKKLYRPSELVLAVVMLASLFASSALAAEGWPGCPWGKAYDPMALEHVTACFSQPAADAAAPKPAGLAQPAPVSGSNQDWWFAREGYDQGSFSEAPAVAASKPAGLAQPAPVSGLSQAGRDCPWGYPVYDTAAQTFVSQCSTPMTVGGAAKPAGLAAPVPGQEQFVPCGFGERLDPLALACQRSAAAPAASKLVGLTQPAPVEKFVPCGFGERLDPLALACQR